VFFHTQKGSPLTTQNQVLTATAGGGEAEELQLMENLHYPPAGKRGDRVGRKKKNRMSQGNKL